MNKNSTFKGSLKFLGLPDVFQILGGSASTGVLKMWSPYAPCPGTIHFVKGNPVNGSYGQLQGLEAVNALFGWTEGQFEFHQKPVNINPVIKHNRMEIVLDALRMLDDGRIRKVGPASFRDLPREASGIPPVPLIRGPLVDFSYVVKEERFRDGEKVVEEGRHGNWIWVVLEGSVNIIREISNSPVTVVRLGEGSFIGTFTSFSFKQNVRTATVVSAGDSYLGLLDTLRLSSEFSSLSFDFRNLLLSTARRLKKVTDLAVSLALGDGGDDSLLRRDDLLVETGSTEEDLFFIESGEAYVVGRGRKRAWPPLALGKLDFFGSVPFMNVGHEPQNASVFASRDIKFRKADTEKLKNEYGLLSGIFRDLMDNAGHCISATTDLLSYLVDEGRGTGSVSHPRAAQLGI